VTVTIVEASKVCVKVGMVGRSVMDAVSVAAGIGVFVLIGIAEGVEVDAGILVMEVGATS
jgi:hypothetical protein